MIYLNSKNLQELVLSKYKYVISDLYGVIYNGKNLFSGVRDAFNSMADNGIKITLLSNAPRHPEKSYERLNNFEFFNKYNYPIVTSGGVFASDMMNIKTKTSYYFIGIEADSELFLNNSNLIRVNEVKDADLVIISHTFDNVIDVEVVNNILEHNPKIVCINPDLIVDIKDQGVKYCAGSVAKMLEFAGCDVSYYGKPHARVYEYLFENYPIEKDKTLIIGDSLVTDIKGANSQEIDSVLTLCGIHAHQIKKGIEDVKTKVESLSGKHSATPEYFVDIFSFDL